MGVLDGPLRTASLVAFSVMVGTSTLVRVFKGDYDPRLGERSTPPDPLRVSVHLLVEDYAQQFIDGKSILEGDVKGSFPAIETTFAPSPQTDHIERGGQVLRIVSVRTYQLDSAYLYELQLRPV